MGEGGGGGKDRGRAIEEGLPVSFKTYQLLGPPRSWDYRLTPTSPARRDRREGEPKPYSSSRAWSETP